MLLSEIDKTSPGFSVHRSKGGMPVVQVPALRATGPDGAWLQKHREGLRAALHEHGFLMLRGLELESPADVAIVRDVLMQARVVNREKTAQRTHFGDDVYSANDLPPAHRIGFHNENSYALEFPAILLFACLEAPLSGGSTAVVDSRKVLAALPEHVATRFRETGWVLTRHYHPHVGQSIESAFGSTDRVQIEMQCSAGRIGHEWLPDGVLRTRQRRTAILRHGVTGEESLFGGHVSFWNRWSLPAEIREILVQSYGDDRLPFETAYGDGTPCGREDIDELNAVYEQYACREPWQRGDCMLVDNLLAAHGRDPFKGKRQVVVAMGELLEVDDCRPTVRAVACT